MASLRPRTRKEYARALERDRLLSNLEIVAALDRMGQQDIEILQRAAELEITSRRIALEEAKQAREAVEWRNKQERLTKEQEQLADFDTFLTKELPTLLNKPDALERISSVYSRFYYVDKAYIDKAIEPHVKILAQDRELEDRMKQTTGAGWVRDENDNIDREATYRQWRQIMTESEVLLKDATPEERAAHRTLIEAGVPRVDADRALADHNRVKRARDTAQELREQGFLPASAANLIGPDGSLTTGFLSLEDLTGKPTDSDNKTPIRLYSPSVLEGELGSGIRAGMGLKMAAERSKEQTEALKTRAEVLRKGAPPDMLDTDAYSQKVTQAAEAAGDAVFASTLPPDKRAPAVQDVVNKVLTTPEPAPNLESTKSGRKYDPRDNEFARRLLVDDE